MKSELVHGCVAGHRLAPLKYDKCDCYGIYGNIMKTEDGQVKYLHYCKVCGMLFVRDFEQKEGES